jgi:hypothetical protein
MHVTNTPIRKKGTDQNVEMFDRSVRNALFERVGTSSRDIMATRLP